MLTYVTFFVILYLGGENNLNERIKSLRKELGLSQEKFGEKIGVTKAAVSRMESATYQVTDSMTKLICSEFNVSEEWLRKGNGEMFIEPSGMTLDEYAKSRNLTDVEFEIIRAYMELPEDFRKMAMEKLATIFERHRKANPTDFWAEAPETSAELEKAYPVDGPSKKTDEVG